LNSSKHLEECIQSVISQDYANIEYVIIDGGSTDGTVEIIKKYSSKLYYWVSGPDHGIYEAMNKGIRNSTGDYIGFLNADDIYCDRCTISKLFEKVKDEDVVYGDYYYMDRLNGNETYINSSKFTYDEYLRDSNNHLCHQTIFVKRSICPMYKTRYKIAGDMNWIYDIYRSTGYSPRYLYVSIPVVKYSRGGYSDQHLTRLFAEWVIVDLRNCGIRGVVRNFRNYAPFLRILQLNYSKRIKGILGKSK
jgi:glycosyltransferase involved in cell wall biosynthesis